MNATASTRLISITRSLLTGNVRRASRVLLNLKVASILSVLGAWWLLSLFTSESILPSPASTFETMREMASRDGPYGKRVWDHFGTTFVRIIASFGVSLVLGTAIGIAMGMRRTVERALVNLVPLGLALPTLLVAFLFILWFGFGELAVHLAVVAVVTPFVIVNVWEGTKAMDKELLDMASAFKATPVMLVTKLIVPQLMPYLFSAFRYGFGVTWKIVLLAETFSQTTGIGVMVNLYYEQFNMAKVFAWLMTFVVVILVLEHLVFARIERRIFKWRHEIAS